MKNSILAPLFALVFSSAALQAQTPGMPMQAMQPVPVLVVNGESQIRIAPDQATVRLGVVRQTESADAAQQQANMVAQEVLAAIGRVGVKPQQIRTSRLTLSPVYAQRRDTFQPPRIVAYSASNVVTVTLDDLTKVGPVVDAGLKAGANELQGVQFEIKNDLEARQQALKQAASEAKIKAQTMAEAMDIRLGAVLEIVEGGASIVPQPFYGGGAEFARMAVADGPPTPVSPGDLEIRASVTVRYRIESK
jgi:uncharacterized protein YggE